MEEIAVSLAASGSERPPGWNDFVPARLHPANSIEYANFYERLGHTPLFLEARSGGERVAQWLVCRRRRRFNPLAALFADCAPQLADSVLERSEDVVVACIEALLRRFRPREFVLLKHALLRGLSEGALRRTGFRRIVELQSYVNVIGGDDELLASFHGSHRNDTRKALREDFRYTRQLGGREYKQLCREMQAASGYAGPEEAVIDAIELTLAAHGRAFFSGVFASERLAAASVILHAGGSAFYVFGASRPDKPRGATTYLHYENMRHLRELGVREYDFGGAGRSDDDDPKARSIALFKERFGGTLVRHFGGSYR